MGIAAQRRRGLAARRSLGLGVMLREQRRALGLLAVAFGPYLVFHSLFQETATTRYALPLVVPVAYAAVRGLASSLPALARPPSLIVSAFNVFGNVQALYWYSPVEAPAFQMLDDMRDVVSAAAPGVWRCTAGMSSISAVRFAWAGVAGSRATAAIAAEARVARGREVLEWRRPAAGLVRRRSASKRPGALRRQRPPVRYRWPVRHASRDGRRTAERNGLAHHRAARLVPGRGMGPYAGNRGRRQGDRPRSGRGGIQGWIRRWPGTTTLMIGGRNLGTVGPRRASRSRSMAARSTK